MSTALSSSWIHETMLDMNKQEFTKRLAANITKVRKQKGLSQEELADRAQLYRTYVGHIENARYSPSAHVVYKIIKALKVSADDILPR